MPRATYRLGMDAWVALSRYPQVEGLMEIFWYGGLAGSRRLVGGGFAVGNDSYL